MVRYLMGLALQVVPVYRVWSDLAVLVDLAVSLIVPLVDLVETVFKIPYINMNTQKLRQTFTNNLCKPNIYVVKFLQTS